MIYYFSAEGNTRYASHGIEKITGEKRRFIPETDPALERFEGESLGFMFPVYSWGVPPIVLAFIKGLSNKFISEIKEKIPIWMVCTCGDDTGKTAEILEKALKERGLELTAAWSVVMPNTYVLLPGFDVDAEELEMKKLDSAIPDVTYIGNKIASKEWERKMKEGSFPGFKSRILYPLFIKYGLNYKKWNWNNECVSCGKCSVACPIGNITMRGGHPKWGKECIGCLACYHICPVHAVGYGKATATKGQYICPLATKK